MFVRNTQLQFWVKKTMNEEMVGDPFSGEFFSLLFLCTRTPPQGENGSVQLYSSTLRQRSGWMMPKRESMGTREWSENRCRMRVLQILPKFLLWFGTIHLNFSWFSVDAWCVYESGMYVCTCLCVSMYCMSLRGLWAQQSLNSGIDVSSSSNEGLQVGLSVDEAHSAQLVQLGLEPHLWGLGLQGGGLSKWALKQKKKKKITEVCRMW